MNANERAPVFTSEVIEIDAPTELVWDVMSNVASWPQWNPDVRDAVVHGELAEGIDFEWKAGPGTIRSTFRTVDRPRELSWTGKTLGIKAIHVYRLENRGATTVVTLEESWDGFPARLFKRRFQKTLDEAIVGGLRALKTESEAQAAAGGPSL